MALQFFAIAAIGLVYSYFRKSSNYPYDENGDLQSMDLASLEGNIDVLNEWVATKLPLNYTEKALYYASLTANIHVLEWWKNSKLPPKYNEAIIEILLDHNIFHKKTKNIYFIKGNIGEAGNCDLPNKINNVSVDQLISVLEWWIFSNIDFKYSPTTLFRILSSPNHHVKLRKLILHCIKSTQYKLLQQEIEQCTNIINDIITIVVQYIDPGLKCSKE